MNPQRRLICFSGRVQGVGFRMTAIHLAQGLDLRGTVRNLPDGRVELLAQGPEKDIETLILRLREQFGAMIRKVEQEMLPAAASTIQDSGIRIIH